ncbi:putative phenylacetate-CoA ligase [Hyaloraphidium curvatum]|nr:putative phenylacetate-CoA ligase [Hyaloraphidium curvatum]
MAEAAAAPQAPAAARSRAYLAALTRFISTPLDESVFAPNDGTLLPEEARRNALHVLSSTAKGVPAYTKFLKDQGLNPEEIASLDASAADADRFSATWGKIPFVEKSNYVNLYPLSERSFGGKEDGMSDFDVLHVSSGSGGKPTFWGRFATDELAITHRFEQLFRDSFLADRTKTLCINALPLGTWVGGLFTFVCTRNLSLKGYDVTVVSPGNDPPEILRVVRELAPLYQAVVVLSYPPFFKTCVDAGIRMGVPWKEYNLRCVFAGEVFSETWRNLLMERTGIKSPCHIVSIYGTADAGVLACETPLSTSVRRFLASRPELARALFGRDRLPSLMQFDPCQRMMELTPGGTLAFSTLAPARYADPTLGRYALGLLAPLVKYNIGDAGGIRSFEEVLAFCRENGHDPLPEAVAWCADAARAERRMPFVWCFGRAFWAVSLYGANVFVDQVMPGLENPEIAHRVTGKFVLGTALDSSEDPVLSVVVELDAREDLAGMASGTVAELEGTIARLVRAELEATNSEYGHYVPADKRLPKVTVKPYGEPEHFKIGVKHKWVST